MNHNCVKIGLSLPAIPFGTTPTPEEYTTISETEIDIGNDLLKDISWETTDLKSTHRHLIPREDYLPPSDPPVQEYKLAVDVEARKKPMDGLINYITPLNIDDSTWVERSKTAALLVIHTIFRIL